MKDEEEFDIYEAIVKGEIEPSRDEVVACDWESDDLTGQEKMFYERRCTFVHPYKNTVYKAVFYNTVIDGDNKLTSIEMVKT